jgi:hypothetical protein
MRNIKKEIIEVEFNFSGFEYSHDNIIDTVLEYNGFSSDEIFEIDFTSKFYNEYTKILHNNMEYFIVDKYLSNKSINEFMNFVDFTNKAYGGTIKSKINLHTLRTLYSIILKNSDLKAKFDDLLREYRTCGAYKYWNVTNKLHLWESSQLGLIIETLLNEFNEHEVMIDNTDNVNELIYQYCDNLPTI